MLKRCLRVMKFDGYTFQARLIPTYIVLLPLAVGLQVWLPEGAILERLGTILVAPAPLAILLAQLGRDRGYRLQKQLWAGWGGAITTQMLRHRRTDGNPVMRQSYHACIERLFPDLNIPTLDEENANPQAADHVYEAATRKLIAATRDRDRFPLIYKENVSYGFRRNLWGLRPLGLILSIGGAVICLVRWLLWRDPVTAPLPDVDWFLACDACLVMAIMWGFWIRRSWVRIPAEAYAERLFESCELLKTQEDAAAQ